MRKKEIKYIKLYKILIIILAICLTASCQKKEEEQQNSDKEMIPQELTTIGRNTENVIEEIEKLQEIIEKPEKLEEDKDSQEKQVEEEKQQSEEEKPQGEEEKQQGEEEKQQGEEEKQQGEEDKQQGEEEKQQGEEEKQQGEEDKQQGEEDKQQGEEEKQQGEEEKDQEKDKQKTISKEIEKMWETIDKKVKEIHTEWNNFEVKSIESGINQEEINTFEESLNGLTIAVNEKDDMKSLSMANEVISSTSRFLNYYKGNIDGEMYKIKYYVRMSLIHGQLGEWEKTEKDIAETQPILDVLRQKIKLEEKDKELLEKLNLSLKDMENVTKNKNKELLKIKRDIVLENLKKLEEVAK